MIFGRRLKELRQERSLSQEGLAYRVLGKRDASRISRWETGKANPPDPNTIRRIAQALDIDPKELLWLAWLEQAPEELKDIIGEIGLSPRLPIRPGVLETLRVVQQAAAALLAGRIAYRFLENTEEKLRLGRFFRGQVPDGGKIFLDAGTTLAICAEELAQSNKSLKIFTNNLLAAVYLLPANRMTLTIIGGELSYEYGSLLGEGAKAQAKEILKEESLITLLGATALSWDEGPCARDDQHGQLKWILINDSKKLLILIDSSKLVERIEPPHKAAAVMGWTSRREDPRTCIMTCLPIDSERRKDFWKALQPFNEKGVPLLNRLRFKGFLVAKEVASQRVCQLVVLDEGGEPFDQWAKLKEHCGVITDEDE